MEERARLEEHLLSLLPGSSQPPSPPEVDQHQPQVDDVGGHAHQAEVLQHEEQDAGQVEGAGERHPGGEHQEQGRSRGHRQT